MAPDMPEMDSGFGFDFELDSPDDPVGRADLPKDCRCGCLQTY